MKNIAEILRNAPRGLILYSLTLGDVEFMKTNPNGEITVFGDNGVKIESFDSFGRKHESGECLLFPSRLTRSWDNWQDTLFRNGDFITIGWDTRLITDLENRRCISPVGDTINFIIDRDTTRWASPVEVSNFMESLEINGWVWDEASLSAKPTQEMYKEITETHEFEKSLTKDLECYHKMKEQGVSEDALKDWIYCWRNTLLGIAKNLYVKEDDSETRTQESEPEKRDSEIRCFQNDDGFTEPLRRKTSELTGRIMELPCVSSDRVREILTELGNWVKDGMVADLLTVLEHRLQELGEIKSREEGHGITSTDMMSVTGGMQEIQILLEKLRTSK